MRTVPTSAALLAAMSGWLALAGLPAQAVPTVPTGSAAVTTSTARPVSSCRYQPDHLRRGETIAVRSTPRRQGRMLGRLDAGSRPVTGGCSSRNGWQRITTPTGAHGWAWNGYLRRSPPQALLSERKDPR
ncbi:SH3 domain-containing protein [Nonomuraea spiralis]|uniref:SH3 domain-containing protein n=1 Tax=Nonomuraea spiralis TaxID=46182 RepID=UPI0037B58168